MQSNPNQPTTPGKKILKTPISIGSTHRLSLAPILHSRTNFSLSIPHIQAPLRVGTPSLHPKSRLESFPSSHLPNLSINTSNRLGRESGVGWGTRKIKTDRPGGRRKKNELETIRQQRNNRRREKLQSAEPIAAAAPRRRRRMDR